MGKLEAGDKAPAFTLPDQDGTTVSLKDFTGSQVVVYFYPRDDTPGCTKEACQFNDNLHAFSKAGVPVLGHLGRQGREAPGVPGQVRAHLPAADRRRPLGGRGLRCVGREDPLRQEVGRGHPLHLPHRRRRDHRPGLVPREGRRPRGQGPGRDRGLIAASGCRSDRPAGRHRGAYDWCSGHHQVVRPPTVERTSSAPSRGHRPPACRSSVISPRWEPPRPMRSSTVRTRLRCSRLRSLGVKDEGRADGRERGPPQDLVGHEVADAGHPRLVEQPGLQGCRRSRRASARAAADTGGGIGSECRHVRVQGHAPQTAGVVPRPGCRRPRSARTNGPRPDRVDGPRRASARPRNGRRRPGCRSSRTGCPPSARCRRRATGASPGGGRRRTGGPPGSAGAAAGGGRPSGTTGPGWRPRRWCARGRARPGRGSSRPRELGHRPRVATGVRYPGWWPSLGLGNAPREAPMGGALHRGGHRWPVHRLRRLRRGLPLRRPLLRRHGWALQAVPHRRRGRPRQLHPRREGVHHVHEGVPALPSLGAGDRQPPLRP